MKKILLAVLVLVALCVSNWPKPKIVAMHGQKTWWMHLQCPPGFKVKATWSAESGINIIDSTHWVNDAVNASCVIGKEVPPDNVPMEPPVEDEDVQPASPMRTTT